MQTIHGIYLKEFPQSAHEIAIKEDLELYEEIKNNEKLVSSLKQSPILEISRSTPSQNHLSLKPIKSFHQSAAGGN